MIPLYCCTPHSSGVPISTVSLSLPISMWNLYCLLCRSCLITPQFFCRRNCSLHSCKFSGCGGRWDHGFPILPPWTKCWVLCWFNLSHKETIIINRVASSHSISRRRGLSKCESPLLELTGTFPKEKGLTIENGAKNTFFHMLILFQYVSGLCH